MRPCEACHPCTSEPPRREGIAGSLHARRAQPAAARFSRRAGLQQRGVRERCMPGGYSSVRCREASPPPHTHSSFPGMRSADILSRTKRTHRQLIGRANQRRFPGQRHARGRQGSRRRALGRVHRTGGRRWRRWRQSCWRGTRGSGRSGCCVVRCRRSMSRAWVAGRRMRREGSRRRPGRLLWCPAWRRCGRLTGEGLRHGAAHEGQGGRHLPHCKRSHRRNA